MKMDKFQRRLFKSSQLKFKTRRTKLETVKLQFERIKHILTKKCGFIMFHVF